MRRPSGVRTGMFCRFGSEHASRPVAATVWWNVQCTRPVRGWTSCGSVSTYVDFSFVIARYSNSLATNPVTGDRVDLEVAPPADFQHLLQTLREDLADG